MQQIIFFFIRNKNFLLFALLFLISVGLTIRSHSFHKTKFTSSANFLSGGIYSVKSNITTYFGLQTENQKLHDENKFLREQLEFLKNEVESPLPDSSNFAFKYKLIAAKVINNSVAKTKNLLTLKKGANQGVHIDMGVISPKGIVGIVNNVSKNYATVQSVINTNSEINARLKNSDHFGSLKWDTKDPNIVQLTDVNRLATVKVGDTIITDGKSTIFPEGILIGTIRSFEVGENDSYNIDIRLFNDMSNLEHVYVIENTEADEIRILEEADE